LAEEAAVAVAAVRAPPMHLRKPTRSVPPSAWEEEVEVEAAGAVAALASAQR
jgi:hypothetical protein